MADQRFRVTIVLKVEDLDATEKEDGGNSAVLQYNSMGARSRFELEKNLCDMLIKMGEEKLDTK